MRKAAKTHLGYIGERPGKDKAEIVRRLFGKGGPYTKEQVAEMIREAPATPCSGGSNSTAIRFWKTRRNYSTLRN
jgi:hypothetical protein